MIRLIAVLFFALIGTANAQQLAGITPCAANSLSVSNVTGNVQLSNCGAVVIVYNITSQEAFYQIGSTSGTAATTSTYSLPGNQFIVLQVPQPTSGYLAAITASSTATLRIVQGRAAP